MGGRVLQPNTSAMKKWARRRSTHSRPSAVIVITAIAFAIYVDRPAAASLVNPPQNQAQPAERQKTAGRPDGDAELKLLADLETAITARADHLDYSRCDRELAAAFRGYGLDLDVVDPKTAGARLAGKPGTPEIAAAIDQWCRVRRTRLKVPTWRRLAEVARAADPDPWRNAIRDQFERTTADALPALRERAADAQALEKQPVNSLLLLAQMLDASNDRPTAAAVVRVAKRRFPRDFWVCLMQGTLNIHGAPNPDPTEAARSCTAAVALRPQSPLAHIYLAIALHQQKKFAEAAGELREATRLTPENADAQVALGYAMEQTGKLDEAIARFRKAVAIKPDDARNHDLLGSALSKQEKFDEAIAAFREAIRIDRNEGQYHLDLGYALQKQGKLDEAIAAYREAIRLAPLMRSLSTTSVRIIASGKRRRGNRRVPRGHPASTQRKVAITWTSATLCNDKASSTKRSHVIAKRSGSTPPIPSLGPISVAHYRSRENMTRQSPRSARPSASTQKKVSFTWTSATRCNDKASSTKPSHVIAKRSGSTPPIPSLGPISVPHYRSRENTTRQSPRSARPSASTQKTPSITLTSAARCKIRESWMMRSPRSTKPSASPERRTALL